MKSLAFFLSILSGFGITVSAYANANSGNSEKIFDGQILQCNVVSDVGNPGFVISKIGQVEQQDGILLSFKVTSKVCENSDSGLKIIDATPAKALQDGTRLTDYEVLVGTTSQLEIIRPAAIVALQLDATSTEFDVLLPKSARGQIIDSFVRAKISNLTGLGYTSFGAFRHYVK